MGAVFGLEGGFVPNRCRNAMSAPSPPSPWQPHRGRVDTVGKVNNEPRSQRPHAACWRAPPAVLGLIATLLADRDRISAYCSSRLSRACRAKQHSKSELSTSIFPLKPMGPSLLNLFIKNTDAGSGGADHLCQCLLADTRIDGLSATFLSGMRRREKRARVASRLN
jgi:hypothetical protein